MKKILAITHYYISENRGGGEVMLHEILKYLVSLGYQVDVVATDYKGYPELIDGVTLYKGIENRAMLDKSYSLVLTQFQNAKWTIEKSKEIGVPVAYIIHNNLESTSAVLESCTPDLLIFNTNWIRDYYNLDIPSVVVHPPVYIDQHRTTPGDRITLINLVPSKGAYVFYNMARYLPDKKFLAVKGGYYKDKQMVMPRRNIRFLENTNDMKNDVWANTKILLMPSKYESYGMAAVEAMASGIPVIASPTPGLKESLGEAGIFPINNTINAWKSTILSLYDEEIYNKASMASIEKASKLDPLGELENMAQAIKRLL